MSVTDRVITRALQLNALTTPPRVPAANGRARDSDGEPPYTPTSIRVPRFRGDDYCSEIISTRQNFVEEYAHAQLHHVRWHSFDPHVTQGNCEHFTGVAQIPLGIAGPLHVEGEHARGDFLVPLATTEGTLVASYNRGMHTLNASGGVKCTIMEDAMQRAPVFVFEDARRGRDFIEFVRANFPQVAQMAETTSNVARLLEIEAYSANRMVYLRFDFSTGDAAGQNMVTKATYAGCQWLLRHFPGVQRFYLESNVATDKKPSRINTLRTRGKRVTAEAVVPRDVLKQRMRVWPEQLVYHNQVANVGAYLSGAMSNGLHCANAVAAIFIATGQDVANVAEASAAVAHTELTPDDDLYISVTVPSLIVATFGGGTALPTQRECLEIMGCYGRGKVQKFAEIVAGTVLAGELSLACAISSHEWVSSHERYGRNRDEKNNALKPSPRAAAHGHRNGQGSGADGNGNGRPRRNGNAVHAAAITEG